MREEVGVPTVNDLLWPTLSAVLELGGSGTNEEINEKILEREDFTEEQQAVLHGDGPKTEIIYRLFWARTDLKGMGAVARSIEEDVVGSEFLHYVRTASAHLWEGVDFVRTARSRYVEVTVFMDGLSPEARETWRRLDGALTGVDYTCKCETVGASSSGPGSAGSRRIEGGSVTYSLCL
jgi:Mrr N-terminal domain